MDSNRAVGENFTIRTPDHSAAKYDRHEPRIEKRGGNDGSRVERGPDGLTLDFRRELGSIVAGNPDTID